MSEVVNYRIPEEEWNRAHTQRVELGPMVHVAAMAIYDQLDKQTQDPLWWKSLPATFERERIKEFTKMGDLVPITKALTDLANTLTVNYVQSGVTPHLDGLLHQNRRGSREDLRALSYYEYLIRPSVADSHVLTPEEESEMSWAGNFMTEGIHTGLVMPVQAYIALQAQRRFATSELSPDKPTQGNGWRFHSLLDSKLDGEHAKRTLSSPWFAEGLEAIAAGKNGSLGDRSSSAAHVGNLPTVLRGRPWILRHGRHPVINPEIYELQRQTMAASRSEVNEPLGGSSGCPVRFPRFPVIGEVAMKQLAEWEIEPDVLRELHQTPIARASQIMGRIIKDLSEYRTDEPPATDQERATSVAGILQRLSGEDW